jgi:hypothetical protein
MLRLSGIWRDVLDAKTDTLSTYSVCNLCRILSNKWLNAGSNVSTLTPMIMSLASKPAPTFAIKYGADLSKSQTITPAAQQACKCTFERQMSVFSPCPAFLLCRLRGSTGGPADPANVHPTGPESRTDESAPHGHRSPQNPIGKLNLGGKTSLPFNHATFQVRQMLTSAFSLPR